MNGRRPIHQKHEICVINDFISLNHKQTGELFEVISCPDPPDAILRSNQRTTWIEVTDAFYSDEWATDKYSYATPGEKHREMSPGPYIGMDEQLRNQFLEIVKQKLSKDSYSDASTKYDPGILIVGLDSPWSDEQTAEMIIEACKSKEFKEEYKSYFSHVFISYRNFNYQVIEECI
jgi:hypothetical protein